MTNQPWAPRIYTRIGITKENIFGSVKALHLGCGNTKLEGSVGIDRLSLPAVDIVHDLNSLPWPVDEESIDVFVVHSTVGHLASITDFLEEAWRVGKNGSRIVISTPYFRSIDAFSDPTMKHFFTSYSFDYFIEDEGHLASYGYSKRTFKKIGFWYGWPQPSKNPLVRIFKAFIHSHPRLYDQYLSLFMPVKVLTWELEVIKHS